MPAELHALLEAIVEDNRAAVDALLRAHAGLPMGAVDESRLYEVSIFHWVYPGDTALHLAAAGHRAEIVELLLKAAANPNSNANHRRSGPAHYAADGFVTGACWDPERQVQTIHRLLEGGADFNAQDLNGATPLHRAVRTRCAAAVAFLLAVGVDPVKRNKSGSTPFHLAVQDTGRGGSGDPKARDAQGQIIEAFQSLGVDVGLRDGKGHSVVDCARSAWVRDLLAKSPARGARAPES